MTVHPFEHSAVITLTASSAGYWPLGFDPFDTPSKNRHAAHAIAAAAPHPKERARMERQRQRREARSR